MSGWYLDEWMETGMRKHVIQIRAETNPAGNLWAAVRYLTS